MSKNKTIGIRINEETENMLKSICKRKKLTISQCIRELIITAWHFDD